MPRRNPFLTGGRAFILAGTLALIVAMILFPPYYVMYKRPAEGLHANAGRCPMWDRPTPADAYEHLRGRPHADPGPAGPDEEQLASYTVGLNKVRQSFEIVLVLLIASAALLVIGRLGRKKAEAEPG